MKSRFTKILSSILILAMLLSMLVTTVFATEDTAPEGGEGETEEEDPTGGITVLYNRNYEEGWDTGNGLTHYPRGQKFSIDYEEDENYNYNYFFRLEGIETETHGYFDIMYGGNSPRDGYSILEFDIKTDDAIENLGNFLSVRHTSSGTFTQLANLKNQTLTLIGGGNTKYNQSSSNVGDATNNSITYTVGELANKWIHVAYVFNFDIRVCPDCHKPFSDKDIEDDTTILCTEHGHAMADMPEAMGVTVYYGYASTFNADKAQYNVDNGGVKDLEKTFKYDTMFVMSAGATAQIHSVRVSLERKAGITFCLDNLRVYNGSPVPIKDLDQSVYGYGDLISPGAEKVIDILKGAGEKSDLEYVESGLAMKLGVDHALYAGTRKPILKDNAGKIYGAPVEIDGKVYVPLQAIIDYIGFPVFAHTDGISYDISTSNGSAFIAIGRDSATVNGEIRRLTEAPNYIRDTATNNTYLVIALEDVDTIFDGYHATYDDMGFILITETMYDRDGNVVDAVSRTDENGLSIMLSLMKKFVVDFKSGDEYYDLVNKGTEFKHPYLLADQATFDKLYAVYKANEGDADYDATLKAYLEEYVRAAKEAYEIYATDPIEYTGIKEDIEMGNPNEGSNGGYSADGRMANAPEHAESMKMLALAYHITHEQKYADLAYDLAMALAEWTHWGPGYMIDLAAIAAPYALAYDWLYNVWSADENKDVSVIEEAIYEKVLVEGYNASNGVIPEYGRIKQDNIFDYNVRGDYWNAVTTNAMVLSSLAVMNATGEDADLYDNMKATAKWLLENNMKTLVEYGLDAYAPDGAFFSGPEYWQKTTDAFVTTLWAIKEATGTDLGMLDIWGLYDTFYYAIFIEYYSASGEVAGEIQNFNSGYSYWNYHDSIGGTLDTSTFFYASSLYGDNTFAAYRVMQLELKPVGYLDLLAYDKAYTELSMSDFELPLDYVLEGCEAYISRDSYEKGSLYVGLMGNTNGVGFGQIDSGNFVYVNKGYAWFVDTGAENPDVAGYYTDPSTRYRYYRMSAEGANVVCVTTDQDLLPSGQLMGASGTLEEYVVEENGMYVILDNKAIYGDLVKDGDAKRGMLVTNNKSTVVLQDEIKFDQVQTAFWIGHTAANISVSDDGKTAYLVQSINGKQYILRASLVSKMNFEFSVISAAEDYLLSKTMKPGESTSQGGKNEYKRTELQRLVIESKEQMSFECAVVFEMVEQMGDRDTAPVQYEWTNMEDWQIGSSFEASPEGDRNALMTDISDYSAIAGNFLARGSAFGDKIFEFHDALCMVAAAEETYRESQIKAVKEIWSDYLDFQTYREQYRAFMRDINKNVNAQKVLANGIGGVQ